MKVAVANQCIVRQEQTKAQYFHAVQLAEVSHMQDHLLEHIHSAEVKKLSSSKNIPNSKEENEDICIPGSELSITARL